CARWGGPHWYFDVW
nr:immunoglobulin heavy chain junction region [Mus musculus]